MKREHYFFEQEHYFLERKHNFQAFSTNPSRKVEYIRPFRSWNKIGLSRVRGINVVRLSQSECNVLYVLCKRVVYNMEFIKEWESAKYVKYAKHKENESEEHSSSKAVMNNLTLAGFNLRPGVSGGLASWV